MIAVWKFEVPIDDLATIDMPSGARLLTVAVQGGSPVLYALVDPSAAKVARRLRVAGTGHPILPDDAGIYVGTVLLHGGALVFHIFDIGEVTP